MTAITAPYTTAIGATMTPFIIPGAPAGHLCETKAVTSSTARPRASIPSIKPIRAPTLAIRTNLPITDGNDDPGSIRKSTEAEAHFNTLNLYSVTSCSGLSGVTSAEVKLGWLGVSAALCVSRLMAQ